jgi:hypothetical protein
MNPYGKLLECLGVNPAIRLCQDGSIAVPLANLRSPFDWYGFPPALIPIWSDGSSPAYFGLWKHWFINRGVSYVQMSIEQERRVVEIARTDAQFLCYATVLAITVHDGVTQSIVDFANKIGTTNLDEIDAVTMKTGDDPKGLTSLPQFAAEIPLESVTKVGDYDGDFPRKNFLLSRAWAAKACSFELDPHILSSWPRDLEKPIWITCSKPQPMIFDEMLESGNLGPAWLTLNSRGWTFADAKKAIRRLSQAAENESFRLMASAWVDTVGDDPGGY